MLQKGKKKSTYSNKEFDRLNLKSSPQESLQQS